MLYDTVNAMLSLAKGRRRDIDGYIETEYPKETVRNFYSKEKTKRDQ